VGNFSNADDGVPGATDVAAVQTPQARRPLFEQNAPAQPPAAPAQSTGGSGYVVQIASYVSQSDANRGYAALKSKHPQIVSQYRPVISQANVGGTTRYRLALGPLASQSAANSVCAKLIAAGERDCLAKRQ
jgi:cell division septation protein DedD